MTDLSLDVRGLREFRRDLRKVDKEVDKEMTREIRSAGTVVLSAARASAPRLTGALASSLKLSVMARGVSIYSNLPYAPVVHWGGTISPRGTPITFRRTEFITQAAESHADKLADEIGSAVERAATRSGWH